VRGAPLREGKGRACRAVHPARRSPRESDEAVRCEPRYRVSVVDDNRGSALSLALMLKIMGHDTRAAHDGLAALEEAEALRPDVALLDIGLPKLDGYETCRLRQRPRGEAMVIIARAGWGQDDKRRSKVAGFNFHLVKPIDPTALERLLAGLLVAPA